MKLKSLLIALILSFIVSPVFAEDPGLRLIVTGTKIRCGSDIGAKTYAFTDEEGVWHGIDVDLCKTFSNAIFGRSDRFEMVDVKTDQIQKAFNENRIDIMLSGSPYSASMEIEKKYYLAGLLYYDNQLFLGKNIEGVTSLEGYKGKRVCVTKGTEDADNIVDFSNKYSLDLQPLAFRSTDAAKEAFFLKRCELLSGNEIYLKGLIKNSFVKEDSLFLIPDVIKVKPVYAFVAKGNETLRITSQWVLNALSLAEEKGISSTNVDIFMAQNDTSIKNLLGIDPKLWEKFNLEPEWMKINTKELGNFGEMIDRNFGEESELKIPRKENKLLKDGGLIIPRPFL